MTYTYRGLAALLAAATATTVGACREDIVEGTPEQYSNVIVALPFTGTFATKAEEHKNALLLAAERFEAAGGATLARPMRLRFVDVSQKAADVLQAEIDSLTTNGTAHVAAIISSSTGAMMNSIPFALRLGVPHIEVSSGSGFDEASAEVRAQLAMPGKQDLFFAPRPLCLPEPEFSADFVSQRIAAETGWANVAIIQNGEAHDIMHADLFVAEMQERITDFSPVTNINLKTSAKTHRQAIDDAKAAGADVIYFHITGDGPNIAFFKAARDANFQGKIVTCGMARLQEVLRVGDPDVAPYLADRLYFQMRGMVPSPNLSTLHDDLRTYTQKGGEIDTFSASAFDAGTLVALGLTYAQAKQTTLAPAILAVANGASTNQAVIEPATLTAAMLDRIKQGEDINYNGAASELEFTTDHAAAPNGHVHFGFTTKGAYYVEQIKKIDDATYEYRALQTPFEVR